MCAGGGGGRKGALCCWLRLEGRGLPAQNNLNGSQTVILQRALRHTGTRIESPVSLPSMCGTTYPTTGPAGREQQQQQHARTHNHTIPHTPYPTRTATRTRLHFLQATCCEGVCVCVMQHNAG